MGLEVRRKERERSRHLDTYHLLRWDPESNGEASTKRMTVCTYMDLLGFYDRRRIPFDDL